MKLIAFTFFTIFSISSLAKSPLTQPATETQFSGYWRIVLIPNDIHKKKFKNEELGYSDPCQFFVHKPDGTWFNISITNMAGADESVRKCPNNSAALEQVILSRPQSEYRWSKFLNRDGLYLIKDTTPNTDTKKPVALIWKSDYILTDIPASPSFNFELKKGDLFMQLMQPTEDHRLAVAWPMILRPIENQISIP